MQSAELGHIAMWASNGYFEIALRPRQIHNHLEVKLCVVSQSSQCISSWILGLSYRHLASFKPGQILGCSIHHADLVTIIPTLDTQNDGWSGFGSWFTIRNFGKQTPNDIARCWQHPSLTHANNVSRASSFPFGKRLAASSRNAKTCFAVNGPSSGA